MSNYDTYSPPGSPRTYRYLKRLRPTSIKDLSTSIIDGIDAVLTTIVGNLEDSIERAGATGGGDDRVFALTDQAVTADYAIPAGRSALTAGPVSIATGVTITIPTGSAWAII